MQRQINVSSPECTIWAGNFHIGIMASWHPHLLWWFTCMGLYLSMTSPTGQWLETPQLWAATALGRTCPGTKSLAPCLVMALTSRLSDKCGHQMSSPHPSLAQGPGFKEDRCAWGSPSPHIEVFPKLVFWDAWMLNGETWPFLEGGMESPAGKPGCCLVQVQGITLHRCTCCSGSCPEPHTNPESKDSFSPRGWTYPFCSSQEVLNPEHWLSTVVSKGAYFLLLLASPIHLEGAFR